MFALKFTVEVYLKFTALNDDLHINLFAVLYLDLLNSRDLRDIVAGIPGTIFVSPEFRFVIWNIEIVDVVLHLAFSAKNNTRPMVVIQSNFRLNRVIIPVFFTNERVFRLSTLINVVDAFCDFPLSIGNFPVIVLFLKVP